MSNESRPDTFRVALREFEPFERALEKIWMKFCQKTGCQLELEAVPMDLGTLHSEILEKEGLKNGKWDVAQLNTDWAAEAFSFGALVDLSDFIDQQPPDDYPAGWTETLLNFQTFDSQIVGLPFHDGPECLIYRTDLFDHHVSQIVGLPFHDGPECLIYRTDLFDHPVEKENYYNEYGKQLRPPETWDEFLDIARFFQRPDENLYGSVFAAFPDGHNTVFDFCLQLWSRGGNLHDQHGNITIQTHEAVAGLQFYRELLRDQSIVHPGSPDFDSVQSGFAFVKGEVAMMVNWFGFASLCEVHETSKVKGKVNVTNIPRSKQGDHVSLNVYWLYVIGSGSIHKPVAYDFLKFAVNAENDKLLTLEGGIGCRLSTWHDAEVNSIVPYYRKMEELHEKARSLPRRKDWAQIAARIDKAVLDVLNTNNPVDDILKKWQGEIDKLQN